VHYRGVALHYTGRENLWEVLYGCPFSLRHRVNLRLNGAGRTADASRTASMSYLTASESHRHCQLVVSSVCVCVCVVVCVCVCVCVFKAYLACSGAVEPGKR